MSETQSEVQSIRLNPKNLASESLAKDPKVIFHAIKHKITLIFLILLAGSQMVGQTVIDPAKIADWKQKSSRYITEMEAIKLELRKQLAEYDNTPPNALVIQDEQGKLQDRLHEMDTLSRQIVLKEMLEYLNANLTGKDKIIFTGGTMPGSGFRAGFGDYDLQTSESSLQLVKDLMKQICPHSTPTDKPDYYALDHLRFTIFISKPSTDPAQLKQDLQGVRDAAADKEVYLHLRLPAPKDLPGNLIDPNAPIMEFQWSKQSIDDPIEDYTSMLKALEILGHFKKGIAGIKDNPDNLFRDPEPIQTFSKAAWKSMEAANLTEQDLQACLNKAGNSRTVNQLKFQIESIKADLYLNPYLAALNPQNFEAYQNTVTEILLLAAERADEKATVARRVHEAKWADPNAEPQWKDPTFRKSFEAAAWLYDIQKEVNEKKLGIDLSILPGESIESLVGYFALPGQFQEITGIPKTEYEFSEGVDSFIYDNWLPHDIGERIIDYKLYTWPNFTYLDKSNPFTHHGEDHISYDDELSVLKENNAPWFSENIDPSKYPRQEFSISVLIMEFPDEQSANLTFYNNQMRPSLDSKEYVDKEREAIIKNELEYGQKYPIQHEPRETKLLACDDEDCSWNSSNFSSQAREYFTDANSMQNIELLGEKGVLKNYQTFLRVQGFKTEDRKIREEQDTVAYVKTGSLEHIRLGTKEFFFNSITSEIYVGTIPQWSRHLGVYQIGRFLVQIGLLDLRIPGFECKDFTNYQKHSCVKAVDENYCSDVKIITKGEVPGEWNQLEKKLRRLHDIKPKKKELDPIKKETGTANISVEGNFKGLVSDQVTTLGISASFPVDWSLVSIVCKPQKGYDLFPAGTFENMVKTAGNLSFDYKPAPIQPPFTETVTLTWKRPDGSETTKSIDLEVFPPPLVLIHGVWSGPGSMDLIRNHLTGMWKYPQEYVSSLDYSNPGNQHIYQGSNSPVAKLSRTVTELMDKVTNDQIKMTKVDIVAHSMGGLIARYYIERLPQSLQEGNNLSKVRRLITLNTPHKGSPVGDWYTYFFNNHLIQCDPKQKDKIELPLDKVTQNEVDDWFIPWLRTAAGMRSNPNALTFGPAVELLQTEGKPGSVLNELNTVEPQTRDVEYYFIAGNKTLIPICERINLPISSLFNDLLYPWRKGNHPPFDPLGPCDEYSGLNPDKNGVTRTAPIDMVNGILDATCDDNMDGVVTIKSQLFEDAKFIRPRDTAILSADHFSITTLANDKVREFLFEGWAYSQPGILGVTEVNSFSPGTLHVYDNKGNHVGKNKKGVAEMNIPGAHYAAFEDNFGMHEYIRVPQSENIKIEFHGNEKGSAGIHMNQWIESGQYKLEFDNISTDKNAVFSLSPSDRKQGLLSFANGVTQIIDPTRDELIEVDKNPPVVLDFTIYPEQLEAGVPIEVRSRCEDKEGSTLFYEWYLDDKRVPSPLDVSTLKLGPLNQGSYNIKLIVTDASGLKASAEQNLRIIDNTGGKITLDDLEDTWPYFLAGLVLLVGGFFYIKKKRGSKPIIR